MKFFGQLLWSWLLGATLSISSAANESKRKFAQDYLKMTQRTKVSLIGRSTSLSNPQNFLNQMLLDTVETTDYSIGVVSYDKCSGREGTQKNRSHVQPHGLNCFQGDYGTIQYLTEIQDPAEVMSLKKVLGMYDMKRFYALIFVSESELEYIHNLPLGLNNKIVFALVTNDETKISLVDFFRAAPGTSLQRKVIGVWTYPSPSKGEIDLTYEEVGRETVFHNNKKLLMKDNFDIWKLRQNFSGLFIRCSVIEDPPYLILRETENGLLLEGPFQFILNYLQDTLQLSYECKKVPGGVYGNYKAKTNSWSGLVGNLIKNETDLAVTYLDMTTSRLQVIDYLRPMRYISRRLFFKKVTKGDEGLGKRYLAEFSTPAWIVVGITFVVFLIVFMLISKLSPTEDKYYSLSDGFLTLTAVFCRLSSEFNFEGTSRRIYLLTMLYSVTLLYVHYTSFLVSYLTVDNYVPPFKTLEGLYNSDYSLRLQKGRNSIDVFRTSPIPIYQKIWKEMLEPYLDEFPKTEKEIKQLVLDGYVCHSAFPDKLMGNDSCGIYQIPFVKIPESWGVQKESPLRDLLNYHVMRIMETGVYYRKHHEIQTKEDYASSALCSASQDSKYAITLSSVYFVHLLFLGGLAFATLLLALEITRHKRSKNKSEGLSIRLQIEDYLENRRLRTNWFIS